MSKYKFGYLKLSGSKINGVLAEWCLIAILLLYPFFATISIISGIPSTPLSIGYRIGYLLLALLIIGLELARLVKRPRAYSAYLVFFTLFWMVYLLRMYYDFYIIGYNSGYAAKGFMFYFQYGLLGSFLPALAIGMVVQNINFPRLFRNVRLLCIPLVACLLYVINHELGLGAEIFLTRFSLGGDEAILSPIAISQYGGLVTIVAFYSILYTRITAIDTLLWLTGMVLLTLGASRGPLIAVLLTHLFIVLYIVRKNIYSFRVWSSLLLGIVALLFLGFRYILPILESTSLFNRVEGSINEGAGLDTRSVQWTAAWNQFINNPIAGDLIVERALNFYPHNLLLEILMATGIIGGSIFLLLFGKSIFNALYIKERFRRAFIYVMVLHFMYAMFSLSIISIPQYWCMLVLVCCLSSVTTSKL